MAVEFEAGRGGAFWLPQPNGLLCPWAPGEMLEEPEYDETSGAWYEYGEEGQGVDTSLISTDGGNRGQSKHKTYEA